MVQTIGKEIGLEILSYAAGGIVNWYNYFLKNKTAKSSKDEDVHTLETSNLLLSEHCRETSYKHTHPHSVCLRRTHFVYKGAEMSIKRRLDK